MYQLHMGVPALPSGAQEPALSSREFYTLPSEVLHGAWF